MMTTNRYDKLMAKAKKLRNKIEAKNTKASNKVAKLRNQIAATNYKKDIYIGNISNSLKDINSLIDNERARILKDYKDYKDD